MFRRMSPLLVSLELLLGLSPGQAPDFRPEETPPSPAPGAWSEAANGLQCRVTQLETPLDWRYQFLFSLQFRNDGPKDLLFDSSSVYDLPLIISAGNGHVVELKPNQEVRRDLRLTEGRTLCRLKPGEMAAFTRPVPSSFQQYGMGYYTIYQPSGRRAWSLFPGHDPNQMPAGPVTVRFVYGQEGVGDSTKQEVEPVWRGRIESHLLSVRLDTKRPKLSASESEALHNKTYGSPLAYLSCELAPVERRVVLGRPCWFRLYLSTGSTKPRQYEPVVNILRPGGLRVVGPDGKALRCLNTTPNESAKLRTLGGQGVVTLSEFDLASAYDLSVAGKYEAQFLETGGEEEAEVVIPASNVAEVEVVGTVQDLLAPPETGPKQFTIRGTVLDAGGRAIPDATVTLWAANEESYDLVIIPAEPGNTPGARTVRSDAGGKYAFENVAPGDYGLLARHPESGAKVGRIIFVFQPGESYDPVLSPLSVSGTLRDKDGATPVKGARITLRPSVYGKRAPWSVTPAALTDEKGGFTIPGATKGDYALAVKLPEDKFDRFGKAITVGGQTAQVALFMPSCSLKGKVITPEGEPVPNASVGLQDRTSRIGAGSKHGQTDKNGEFTFAEIAEGSYVLNVNGPPRSAVDKGAPSDRARMHLTFSRELPQQELKIKLGMEEPRITVKVFGMDGSPLRNQTVMGAVVSSDDSSSGGFRTNEDGVLSCSASPGAETHVRLIVESLAAWGEARVTPEERQSETKAEIRLQPCGSASGRVIEKDTGRPLGGIAVAAFPVPLPEKEPGLTGMEFPFGLRREQISQDGTGAFKLMVLPPGEYEVRLCRGEWPYHETEDPAVRFAVSARETTEGIEVPAAPMAGAVSVGGLLVDRNDKPIPNRELALGGETRTGLGDSSVRRVRTDAEGRFVLYPVDPDFYEFLPFFPGERKPAGPAIRFEAKPGRKGQEIRVPLGIAQETQADSEMPPPDPPGTWGKTVDGLRTRLTPVKPRFEQFEPVAVRIELENTGKWPKHYDTQGLKRSFRGRAPDAKPLRHIAMPYQTGSGFPGPIVAPGDKAFLGEVDLTDEFDLSHPGKHQVQYHGLLPASNVVELEVVERDKDKHLPSIGLALPAGLVEAIEAVLPKDWAFGGTDRAWKREEPGYNYPRSVWILYAKTVSTGEAVRDDLSYSLLLYDRRLKGPGLVPVEDMRLLGENDWYRAYAKGQPDPKYGWKEPDKDIIKALKLGKADSGPTP